MTEDGETLTWQQQAETYQTALESALAYQQKLEEEISGLICSLQHTEGEWTNLEREHEAMQRQHNQEIHNLACSLRSIQEQLHHLEREHESALRQRDQVISDQTKEIAHISHILQIQQCLLRVRHPEAK